MKKMFIIASFSMLLLSCQNNIQNVKPYKTGATIKLNIDTKSFAKKSNDASIPKTSADIKSYTAFLTTDKTKPFSQETFVSISVNKTDETSILFEEIPEGGPYYAVVAALTMFKKVVQKKI
jgi:hypothetical protein